MTTHESHQKCTFLQYYLLTFLLEFQECRYTLQQFLKIFCVVNLKTVTLPSILKNIK